MIIVLGRPFKDRRGELHAQSALAAQPRCVSRIWPTFMREGTPSGFEHDLDRRSVRQERHIFVGQNAGDDALVAVTAGHLVAHRELALHGDVDLDHLDDAGRKLVALLQLGDLLVGQLFEHLNLAHRHLFDVVDPLVEVADSYRLIRMRFRSRARSVISELAVERLHPC